MVVRLFNAEAGASATSSVITPKGQFLGTQQLWQVTVTVAGTVTLQGRLSSDLPWVTVATTTSTAAALVQIWPEMRATLTGNTGSVDLALDVLAYSG